MNPPQFTYTTNLPEMPVSPDHIVKSDKKPLRLEAGKSYLNRRGDFVGPLEYSNPIVYGKGRPFTDKDGRIYSREGFAGMIITDECPFDLVTEHIAPSEEDRAKAALEDGWLGPINGPLKSKARPGTSDADDVALWVFGAWDRGAIGDMHARYALRAGSEIARKNGLEPLPTPPVRPEGVPEVPPGLIYLGIGQEIGDRKECTHGFNPRFDSEWDAVPTAADFTHWTTGGRDVHYADEIGGVGHRAMPWFHESQLLQEKVPTTVSQWLARLNDGYRERALAAMKHPDSHAYSMPVAIAEMATWSQTEEGLYFWEALYWHYSQGSPIPALPETTSNLKETGSKLEVCPREESQAVAENRYESARIVTNEDKSSKTVTAYPPDESEWPEKPDAGNFIRVTMTCEIPTTHKDGESIRTVEDHIRKNPDFATGYMKDVSCELIPFAVPAPQWRDMLPEETIQGGDEVDRGAGYVPADASIGLIVGHSKARTRRPLPPPDAADPVSGVNVPGEKGWLPIATADTSRKRVVRLKWGIEEDPHTADGFYRDGKWFAAAIFYKHGVKDGAPYSINEKEVVPTHWQECHSYDEAPPAERKAREVWIIESDPEWYSVKQEGVPSVLKQSMFREVLDGIGGDQ